MIETLLAAKAAIVASWFLSFFVLERIFSAAPRPAQKNRLVKNGGLWLVNLPLSPLIVVPLTLWGANHAIWMRPDWMMAGAGGMTILIVDLILLDLWTYSLHRAYHRIPFLWRFHQIHHRDEFLDTTSAVRFHFGEIAISALLRLIPITLLALPLATVIIFETALFCASLFHHSNVRLPERLEKPLSKVFITPRIHWVHHHAEWKDTNSNYGAILSIWDRLLASRSPTERQYGMKIGVEGAEDQGYLRLIFMPFRGRK